MFSNLYLKNAIKAEAFRLGFTLVGVTLPNHPMNYDVYERWLEQGHQAGMNYMATERARLFRSEPGLILPQCKSILVTGLCYGSPVSTSSPDYQYPWGRVAAYAWGIDYHEVILARLTQLAAYIHEVIHIDVMYRAYTDTGPLLERELAQQAGLGWIGKNSCLISPTVGSFLFLAELFLSLALEPDPPFIDDRCGRCSRCIEACPTQCILPDRTIDANRCIAYHTIENKGVIPLAARSKMGRWVFGCDVCQMVCPWNRKQESSPGDSVFAPMPGAAYPDLIGELSLTPQGFNRKFLKSPIKRARRRGYLRNVAIALGNWGDDDSQPVLENVLMNESEELVRGAAAWALGQINSPSVYGVLEKARLQETEPQVLTDIDLVLENLKH